jgi:hypothetical protein
MNPVSKLQSFRDRINDRRNDHHQQQPQSFVKKFKFGVAHHTPNRSTNHGKINGNLIASSSKSEAPSYVAAQNERLQRTNESPHNVEPAQEVLEQLVNEASPGEAAGPTKKMHDDMSVKHEVAGPTKTMHDDVSVEHEAAGPTKTMHDDMSVEHEVAGSTKTMHDDVSVEHEAAGSTKTMHDDVSVEHEAAGPTKTMHDDMSVEHDACSSSTDTCNFVMTVRDIPPTEWMEENVVDYITNFRKEYDEVIHDANKIGQHIGNIVMMVQLSNRLCITVSDEESFLKFSMDTVGSIPTMCDKKFNGGHQIQVRKPLPFLPPPPPVKTPKRVKTANTPTKVKKVKKSTWSIKLFSNGMTHVTGLCTADECIAVMYYIWGISQYLAEDANHGIVKIKGVNIGNIHTSLKMELPLLSKLNLLRLSRCINSKTRPEYAFGCNLSPTDVHTINISQNMRRDYANSGKYAGLIMSGEVILTEDDDEIYDSKAIVFNTGSVNVNGKNLRAVMCFAKATVDFILDNKLIGKGLTRSPSSSAHATEKIGR